MPALLYKILNFNETHINNEKCHLNVMAFLFSITVSLNYNNMGPKIVTEQIETMKKRITDERIKYEKAFKEDRPFAETKSILGTLKAFEEELRLLLKELNEKEKI